MRILTIARSVTDGLNAAAEIHFTGNAISLYGATSSNHGSFSVSLDGAAPVILNGTAPTFRPQTLLVSCVIASYHTFLIRPGSTVGTASRTRTTSYPSRT
jgi:hypothetical protein